MSTASDRRAPGMARIPFDAMVEVGGALGPSFEAQAVNLSEEGMQLRTAYLPEVGQPVMCRFDAGQGMTVVAAGEVLWRENVGDGGEFGIRFMNLDAQSTSALQRIIGLGEDGSLPRAPQGKKVRLHIDGLASPMRARVRDQHDVCVTAYSELGFLQVGKPLDLEDAVNGSRRAALIDRVDVELDADSRIPQLVVTLRYDDTDARNAQAAAGDIPVHEDNHAPPSESDAPMTVEAAAREEMANDDEDHVPARARDQAEHGGPHDQEDDVEAESRKLKGSFARNASKVAPALLSWAARAKTTVALLAAKAKAARAGGDAEVPVRRTTAPAPGGGLHAAGRRVVRGSMHDDEPVEEAPKPGFKVTKKKIAVAGALGTAVLLAFFAMRKPAPPAPLAAAPPVEASALPNAGAAPVNTATGIVPPPNDPLAAAAAAKANGNPLADMGGMSEGSGKKGKPQPFTNGAVGAHGNTIKVHMDGSIDAIEGAPDPTGFMVFLPGRKTSEAAGSLASKDPRIAAFHVENEASGARLTVSFKDGTPNYNVRAKGSDLEITLAKPNANGDKAPAAHAGKKKHGKKHH